MVAAGLLGLPGTSLAATQTIGQVGSGGGIVSGVGHDIIQTSTTPGAPRYSFPSDGAVTEWRHQAEGGETAPIQMAVYRVLSTDTFLVVAKTAPLGMTANLLNGFPVSPPIQVKAGDLLGMRVIPGGQVDFASGATPADVWAFRQGNAPVGTTFTGEGTMMATRADIAVTFDPEETITGAGAVPRRFAAVRGGPAETPTATSSVAQGTTFRFSLSDSATVTYSIARAFRGKLVNGVCTKAKRKKKKGKTKAKSNCTGYETVGSFRAPGGAGENARPFSGVLGKRPLAPGTYRATLTARDSAGSVSEPATADFTIVKPKKRRTRRG